MNVPCPSCGRPNPADARACRACDAPLDTPEALEWRRSRISVMGQLRRAIAASAMGSPRGSAAIRRLIDETDSDGCVSEREGADWSALFEASGDYGAARQQFIRTIKAAEDVERAALASLGDPLTAPPTPPDAPRPRDSDAGGHADGSADDGVRELEALVALHRRHRGDGTGNQPFDDAHREAVQWRIASVKDRHTDPSATPRADDAKWDVFISYASEDKDSFVRELAIALRAAGLRVWYDEFVMDVGTSIRTSINEGIAMSRWAVVIVSPTYLYKEWPQRELDGLTSRLADGMVILPVWHNVTVREVRARLPMLADSVATSSHLGLPQVVRDLLAAIRGSTQK